MSKAKMLKINYGQDVLRLLIGEKIIQGVKAGKGYLVARYGVNKKTLQKEAKKFA